MGSKADGVNLTEIRETALGSLGGGQPRPIRKRGYYRALKRGEHWAVLGENTAQLIRQVYGNIFDNVLKENPFLKLAGLSSWLPEDKLKVDAQPATFFGTDRTQVPLLFTLPHKESVWRKLKLFFIGI